ncbi:MAG: enoyl-CoA hydratase-related protein [Methanomassiliicoccales archaeon]
MDQEVLIEKRDGYSVLRLNRPAVLNALSFGLVSALSSALELLDKDEKTKAAIITGDTKAFAAGADIKELASASYHSLLKEDPFRVWDRIMNFSKPLIAAVEGFALGGGCELAMCCDIIVASSTAVFGQPEINLGIMPGAGGTQRLSRAVGRHMASYLMMTGERMDAQTAMQAGLLSRLVPAGEALKEAERIAAILSSKSLPSLMAVKRAILLSQEVPLSAGLRQERTLFYSLFALEDRKEGMDAFISKRRPIFRDR